MTDDTRDLDAMLGTWAASVRLTDAEAARIRQAVVRESASDAVPTVTATPLAPSWWKDFSLQVSDVMVDAGRAGAVPFAA